MGGKTRSEGALPMTAIPLVCSHGQFTVQHLLVSASGAPGDDFPASAGSAQLRVTSWSDLSLAPPFADLAALLTSIAFEVVRLPVPCAELQAVYSGLAEAGGAPQYSACAHQLRISERTATRLLHLQCSDAGTGPHGAEALMDIVQAATCEEASEAAWLVAWLRSGSSTGVGASAAVEARNISEALCDWNPGASKRAVRGEQTAVGMVSSAKQPRRPPPPPPPALSARRQRVDVPSRVTQWGWQVLREFREAAVSEGKLPSLDGSLAELWPALWLVPCLRHSLALLDAPSCPWPQKVWLLHHIGGLIQRLLHWLDEAVATRPEPCLQHLASYYSVSRRDS